MAADAASERPAAPTDAELWRCVESTVLDVLLPALPESEEWARVVAVQLVGLVRYAATRPADPTADRVVEITAALHALAANEIVATVWDGDRSDHAVMAAAGAALAGAVLPSLSLVTGWRGALGIAAAAGIAVVVVAQAVRGALDVHRRADDHSAFARALDAVRRTFRDRELASIALLSLVYAAAQVCLTTFLVVHLTSVLGWSLVAAGLGLSVGTAGGVAGRIVWGALSDRTQQPRAVLGVIGVIAGACSVITALSTPAWPAFVIYATVAVFGATAIGWNGVMLAEVARLAPPGQAGATTGATGFVTFGGVMAGPPLFAALSTATGGTRAGYVAIALLSGLTGLAILLQRPRRTTDAKAAPRRIG